MKNPLQLVKNNKHIPLALLINALGIELHVEYSMHYCILHCSSL